jgi:hypothetical protein
MTVKNEEEPLRRIKDFKPIFIENSFVPRLLSKISPIEISAISILFLVFCRETASPEMKVHETIHYQQWIELLFVGFPVLYVSFWVRNLFRGMSPANAYYNIPFEIEAYNNEGNLEYLRERESYNWRKDI